MNRRGLFLGAAAFLAAPSIVRAQSLMPGSTVPFRFSTAQRYVWSLSPGAVNWAQAVEDLIIWGNADIKTPMGILRASARSIPLAL